jgi:hypothetical protein
MALTEEHMDRVAEILITYLRPDTNFEKLDRELELVCASPDAYLIPGLGHELYKLAHGLHWDVQERLEFLWKRME